MTNKEIAVLLKNVAAAYSIQDEKRYKFQILAYQKAADSIASSVSEVNDLYEEERLGEIPGVGPSIRGYLEELITTGKVGHFEAILKDFPLAVFPLLQIPSFGPKKAYKLVTAFDLSNSDTVIGDVERLAKEGKIASLESFGEKSQSDILKAIQEYHGGKTKDVRMPLPFASELAEKLLSYLKKSPAILEAYPLGSLRRVRETIGDIDIAVVTNNAESAITHFVGYPYKERILGQGENDASLLLTGGMRVDLRTESKKGFGSLLQHFTGSKEHNIHLREYALKKGYSLSEYGIKEKDSDTIRYFETEEKFYKFLGLAYIPPELREDRGEIEAALHNSLPCLVELADIRGDFHLHSSYPIEPSHDMGKHTMQEMIDGAKSRNYLYVGFSEHNPSVSKHTDKEMYTLIVQRENQIQKFRKSNKDIRIFSLLETDILTDGSLALPDEALELLDGSIVSIHSSFSMDKKSMTKRVLQGLSHPKAKILAHPTGRLINERNGYDLDWEEVFAFCRTEDKAVEISASPQRLDLPDTLVRRAIEQGVKFFINTDSHAIDHMSLMKYGVMVARRGWATKDHILNTWDVSRLAKWFET